MTTGEGDPRRTESRLKRGLRKALIWSAIAVPVAGAAGIAAKELVYDPLIQAPAQYDKDFQRGKIAFPTTQIDLPPGDVSVNKSVAVIPNLPEGIPHTKRDLSFGQFLNKLWSLDFSGNEVTAQIELTENPRAISGSQFAWVGEANQTTCTDKVRFSEKDIIFKFNGFSDFSDIASSQFKVPDRTIALDIASTQPGTEVYVDRIVGSEVQTGIGICAPADSFHGDRPRKPFDIVAYVETQPSE